MLTTNTSASFQFQENSTFHQMLRGIALRHPEAKPDEYAVLWQRSTGSTLSKHKWHGFIPWDWIYGAVAGQDILPGVLELERTDNVFLTVSRYFKGWAISPLLKTLGALYVDLDAHKPPFNMLDARSVWEEIKACEVLEDAGIPLPTLVVFSGCGLHLLWILEAEGAEAYPFRQVAFRKCQERLIEIFSKYGADANPKDPTRYLRLEGSTHHIDGPVVESIQAGEATHSFPEMAKALGVDSYRRRPARKVKGAQRRNRGKRRGVSHLPVAGTPGPLNNPKARHIFGHLRMGDLVAVSEDVGGFTEGMRNTALLAYVTAGRLAGQSDVDMETEALEFNRGFTPPLQEREAERVVQSITRRRKYLNGRGKYAVHSNVTLIALLGVTEEQQRRLYLRTLISPQEKERRKQENLQESPIGKEVLQAWYVNPGITQKALEAIVGCDQSTISRTLQGANIRPNHPQGRPRKSDNHHRRETCSQQRFAAGW